MYTPPSVATKDVEVKAPVTTKEKYNDELGAEQERERTDTVHATVTVRTKSASARVSASYSLITVETAAVAHAEAFESSRHFSQEWGTYTGDKRALGDYTALCARSEPAAPSELELVTEAALEVSRSVGKSLRAFLH